jgi:hypothetical protein
MATISWMTSRRSSASKIPVCSTKRSSNSGFDQKASEEPPISFVVRMLSRKLGS